MKLFGKAKSADADNGTETEAAAQSSPAQKSKYEPRSLEDCRKDYASLARSGKYAYCQNALMAPKAEQYVKKLLETKDLRYMELDGVQRVAVITGVFPESIGFYVAMELFCTMNMHVICIGKKQKNLDKSCRLILSHNRAMNDKKPPPVKQGEESKETMTSTNASPRMLNKIYTVVMNPASLGSVKKAARSVLRICSKIDKKITESNKMNPDSQVPFPSQLAILAHAASSASEARLTEDGIEYSAQCNYLAPHYLTRILLPRMRRKPALVQESEDKTTIGEDPVEDSKPAAKKSEDESEEVAAKASVDQDSGDGATTEESKVTTEAGNLPATCRESDGEQALPYFKPRIVFTSSIGHSLGRKFSPHRFVERPMEGGAPAGYIIYDEVAGTIQEGDPRPEQPDGPKFAKYWDHVWGKDNKENGPSQPADLAVVGTQTGRSKMAMTADCVHFSKLCGADAVFTSVHPGSIQTKGGGGTTFLENRTVRFTPAQAARAYLQAALDPDFNCEPALNGSYLHCDGTSWTPERPVVKDPETLEPYDWDSYCRWCFRAAEHMIAIKTSPEAAAAANARREPARLTAETAIPLDDELRKMTADDERSTCSQGTAQTDATADEYEYLEDIEEMEVTVVDGENQSSTALRLEFKERMKQFFSVDE